MKTILEDFYSAFSNLDAETMVQYYHEDIVFNDPAFGTLKGDKAKNMWRMLCGSQKKGDVIVKVSNIEYIDNLAYANWETIYTYTKTGRKVHNKVNASFKLKNDKIIEHIDVFNLHSWAKQALGFKGFLLGGTSFFKTKMNERTNMLLSGFEKKQLTSRE